MQILRKYKKSRTRTPLNQKSELETFIGVLIYPAQFLPHLATASAPLADLLSQNEFEWRPLHEETFQSVKHLAKNLTHSTKLTINHPTQFTSSMMLLKLEQAHG